MRNINEKDQLPGWVYLFIMKFNEKVKSDPVIWPPFDREFRSDHFSAERSERLETLDFWIDKVEHDLEVRLDKNSFRKLKNKLNKIWRKRKITFDWFYLP